MSDTTVHTSKKKDAFFQKGHLLDVQKSKKRLRGGKSKKAGKAHFTRVYKDREGEDRLPKKFPTMKSLDK